MEIYPRSYCQKVGNDLCRKRYYDADEIQGVSLNSVRVKMNFGRATAHPNALINSITMSKKSCFVDTQHRRWTILTGNAA